MKKLEDGVIKGTYVNTLSGLTGIVEACIDDDICKENKEQVYVKRTREREKRYTKKLEACISNHAYEQLRANGEYNINLGFMRISLWDARRITGRDGPIYESLKAIVRQNKKR